MRRFVTLCIVVAAGALIVYIGYISTTQTIDPLDQNPVPAERVPHDNGTTEFSTTTPHGHEISVRYPSTTVESVQNFIQEEILALVDTSIEQFESYANRCSDSSHIGKSDKDRPCSPTDIPIVPWQLSIDYSTFVGEEQVAYLFDIYEYTGGAHGNGSYKAFSYNKNTGKEIEFRDVVSALEERAFMEALDRTVRTWFITEGYGDTDIQLGTTLPEYGVATFITDDGVGVAFSAYTLGSYTLGVPVVTVPFTAY
jgi:hypothetical protein